MVSLLGVTGTPHTVRWETRGPDTGDGPTWVDAQNVQVRMEPVSRQVQLPTGRVTTIVADSYWPAAVEPAPGDRVTWGERRYKVAAVDSLVWFTGTVMHHEVALEAG